MIQIIVIFIGLVFVMGMIFFSFRIRTLSDGISKTAMTDERELEWWAEHHRLHGETEMYRAYLMRNKKRNDRMHPS